ncbi:MAG: ABC transporter ATP-binding protein [Bacilli bacterium]|nr:ABC transporter ATP-binding protein [Bacilli bacterium]
MNSYEDIDYKNEKIKINIWKKIAKMVLKKKGKVIILVVTMFILAFLDIMTPIVNKLSIDKFFQRREFDGIIGYALLYIGLAVAFMICIWVFINVAGKVEVEIGYEVRKDAFIKLQELPFSYYDKTAAGWIIARVTSDSRKLADILSWGIVDILWGLFSMIGILIAIFIYQWQLGLIVLGITPLLYLSSAYFHKKILASYRDVRKTNSQITASYNEGMMGSKTTKTLVLEDVRYQEFEGFAKTMKHQSIRAITYSSLILPILLFIGYLGVAVILPVGVAIASVTLLYLVISYTINYFEPVAQIARVLADFQQAQASAERILMLIETTPEIKDTKEIEAIYGDLFHPKKENWEPLKGDVEFDHVRFSYTEQEVVLKDFNLKVKAGTSVALVGTTGSGKSTIINLLCRFYEPTTGTIKIDGRDYKKRSIGWLHHNLGYVLQTPHLFNGTIMENIRYGRLDATDEEVIAAAKAVYADEFIENFDEKYQTNVGEGGGKLSVGQRQLLSFARAILADPKILILDEATSSIDTETEHNIQEVINKILIGRTSFIVAHRLSTIINADIILVIKNGEIIEQGTHRELLTLEKEYYQLYKNQFINEKIEKTKY